jgi:hypothetical protein
MIGFILTVYFESGVEGLIAYAILVAIAMLWPSSK